MKVGIIVVMIFMSSVRVFGSSTSKEVDDGNAKKITSTNKMSTRILEKEQR